MGASADLAGRYYTSKPDRPEYKMTQMNISPQSAVFISPYYAQEHVLVPLTGWFSRLFFFLHVCCATAKQPNYYQRNLHKHVDKIMELTLFILPQFQRRRDCFC